MHRFHFLFGRFRPERYQCCLIFTVMNFLIAITPACLPTAPQIVAICILLWVKPLNSHSEFVLVSFFSSASLRVQATARASKIAINHDETNPDPKPCSNSVGKWFIVCGGLGKLKQPTGVNLYCLVAPCFSSAWQRRCWTWRRYPRP